jgi:hypothetical protein
MDKVQKPYDSSYSLVMKGLYPTNFVTPLEAPFGEPTDEDRGQVASTCA